MAKSVLIVGLGRIGLPTALVMASSGLKVYGVDVDKDLVELLRGGNPVLLEPGLKQLLDRSGGFFRPLTPYELLQGGINPDYVVVCIGVNVENGKTKLEPLFKVVEWLGSHGLLDSSVLVLRTTVPLGTSDKIVSMLKARFGLIESKDYYYAYVPERLAEGAAVREEIELPKLVGVYSDEAFARVKDLLGRYSRGPIVKVKPPIKAELVKLIDNAWRNLIFGFANEIALLADKLGLDPWEIIELANYDYPRNNIPFPGPVSGYCLTKDPYILEETYRSLGLGVSLWLHARISNDRLLELLYNRIMECCRNINKDAKLLVLGLAYKKDVDDFRFSHSIELVRRIVRTRGSLPFRLTIMVHDPYYGVNRYTRLPEDLVDQVKVVRELSEGLAEADVVTLLTPHTTYEGISPSELEGKCVVDAWHVLKDKCLKARNCRYAGLG